jgi:hypothetical protein
MIYLQLINAVLARLREDVIGAESVDSDPYYRSIGAWVNDAKNRVEDAWQWGALRGTDVIDIVSNNVFSLPNSADNHYIIKRMYSSEQYDPLLTLGALTELRQVSVDAMRQRYQGGTGSFPTGQPQEYAVTGTNPTTGDIAITVYPPPGPVQYSITVDRVSHQSDLVEPTDRLLVPSLPVYTLATALASRERGEVGGTTVSELFAIADSHLSDAIAQDSALYPNELVWYGGITNPAETNHGNH